MRWAGSATASGTAACSASSVRRSCWSSASPWPRSFSTWASRRWLRCPCGTSSRRRIGAAVRKAAKFRPSMPEAFTLQLPPEGNPMTELVINGMTCESWAAHVRQALEKVPGVHSAQVSYPKGTARLTLAPDIPVAALVSAVAAAGYGARVPGAAPGPSRDGGFLERARGGGEALHVAVIGSGGAAIAAALKAAERGA